MPPLCRFYGIVIVMNFDEPSGHVPHFHARYAGAWASFSIEPLKLLAGAFPSRARRMVREWARMHKNELLENWSRAERGEQPVAIAPLD